VKERGVSPERVDQVGYGEFATEMQDVFHCSWRRLGSVPLAASAMVLPDACADVVVDQSGAAVLVYSEDLGRNVACRRRRGGTVLVEPYDFPGGRRFQFADPSGNELGVWGPSSDPNAHH
jgi:hypothetical protein